MLQELKKQNYIPISAECREDVLKVFDKINKLCNNSLDGVSIEFCERQNKTYLGLYYFQQKRIVLYPQSEKGIIATLIHECVHAIDTGNNHGHDKWFWYNLGVLTSYLGMAYIGTEPKNIDIEEIISSRK